MSITMGHSWWRTASFLSLALGSLFVSGCGNGWFGAGARKASPSALMVTAQKAFDAENYQTAAALYEEILSKDENNDEARVRLAFSYNAQGGVAVYDILQRSIQLNQKSTALALATGANTTGLGDFTGIVGLTAAEKKEAQDRVTQLSLNLNNLVDVRKAVPRMATLQKSWTTVCRLLPASVIADVANSNEVVANLLDISACKGGNSGTVNGGAIFAAVMQSVAQAAVLYQLVIDTAGDGTIAAYSKAQAATESLTASQTKISAANTTSSDVAVVTAALSVVQTEMDNINTQVKALVDLKSIFSSESVKMTMAHFRFIGSLVKLIPGIPTKVTDTIDKSTSSLTAAETKLNEYSDPASRVSSVKDGSAKQAGPSTNTSAVQSATKTREAMTTSYNKQVEALAKLPDSPEKTVQIQKQAAQKTLACNNFDVLKVGYGLPADTQRPDFCPASVALNFDDAAADQLRLSLIAQEESIGAASELRSSNAEVLGMPITEAWTDFVQRGYSFLH